MLAMARDGLGVNVKGNVWVDASAVLGVIRRTGLGWNKAYRCESFMGPTGGGRKEIGVRRGFR